MHACYVAAAVGEKSCLGIKRYGQCRNKACIALCIVGLHLAEGISKSVSRKLCYIRIS